MFHQGLWGERSKEKLPGVHRDFLSHRWLLNPGPIAGTDGSSVKVKGGECLESWEPSQATQTEDELPGVRKDGVGLAVSPCGAGAPVTSLTCS